MTTVIRVVGLVYPASYSTTSGRRMERLRHPSLSVSITWHYLIPRVVTSKRQRPVVSRKKRPTRFKTFKNRESDMGVFIIVKNWMADTIDDTIGPFDTRIEAKQYIERLKGTGFNMDGVQFNMQLATTPAAHWTACQLDMMLGE
jgi:hypothetical protein